MPDIRGAVRADGQAVRRIQDAGLQRRRAVRSNRRGGRPGYNVGVARNLLMTLKETESPQHDGTGVVASRGVPVVAHVAALSVLFAVGIVRFLPLMLNADERGYWCEQCYYDAISAVQAGRSPYGHTYLYPPTLALVGAAAAKVVGVHAFVLALRYANLFGGCLAVWLSLQWLGLRLWQRIAIATALVIAWPPLASGIKTGNISPLVTGLTIASLCTWRRRPLLAGTALGWAVALKPTSVVALGMLPLFGRFRSSDRKSALLTAGIAGAWCIASLLFGAPYLGDLVRNIDPQSTVPGNTSIYRVFYVSGVVVPPVLLLAMVGVIAAWLAWRFPARDRTIVCLVACMALLSMPIVWMFTLLLALPIQCEAVLGALRRFRGSHSRHDWSVLQGVICGVLAVTFAEYYGGAAAGIPLLESVLVATPLIALALLTRYVVRARPPLAVDRGVPPLHDEAVSNDRAAQGW